MTQGLTVEVWSDVACPWCYIGKRRFAEGVRRYEEAGGGIPVTVEYRSFELSPDTPVDFEGDEVEFLARHKGMPEAQVRELIAHVKGIAASEGLDYDIEHLKHTNTLKAHELLHLAKAHGVQAEMKERLLSAYFVEGRHVGHVSDLADLAAEVGIDRDEAVTALETGRYAADVQADVAQARAYGINGVPFYVIDGRYGVSGAQSPDLFASALAQAAAERAEEPA
jgi:predicted DsbA family dithiol-disulfide isomerase